MQQATTLTLFRSDVRQVRPMVLKKVKIKPPMTLAKIWAIALAVSTTVGAATAATQIAVFFYLHKNGSFYDLPIRLSAAFVSFLTTMILVSWLLRKIQLQRRSLLHRMEIIAECNHHIRNAMQVMLGAAPSQAVRASADRITMVLCEILPHVADEEYLSRPEK